MINHPELKAEPQAWEFEPIIAMAAFDFSLIAESESMPGFSGDKFYQKGGRVTQVVISFKEGDLIVGRWTQRDFIAPMRLSIDFEKNGFLFRLNETDFFKLFKEVDND
jgi:hypothetical protein